MAKAFLPIDRQNDKVGPAAAIFDSFELEVVIKELCEFTANQIFQNKTLAEHQGAALVAPARALVARLVLRFLDRTMLDCVRSWAIFVTI